MYTVRININASTKGGLSPTIIRVWFTFNFESVTKMKKPSNRLSKNSAFFYFVNAFLFVFDGQPDTYNIVRFQLVTIQWIASRMYTNAQYIRKEKEFCNTKMHFKYSMSVGSP